MGTYDRRVLALLIEEAHDWLDRGDTGAASATLAEADALDADNPQLRTLRAQLAFEAGALDDALAHAQVALAREPSADAHYTAARVYEERGKTQERTFHDLEALRLDTADDLRFGRLSRGDVDALEQQAEAVLSNLPASVAETVRAVPVVLEARPHPGIVLDGFDPRAVGLFEGSMAFEDMVSDRPTRIVIFYANLIASCRDEAELEEQLRITLLHEIGHALGLDEDEVDALGLG